MISKALTFRILLPRLSATGFAVQVHDRKTKNMLDNTDYDGQNVAQHSVQRAHALRAVRHFVWLETNSGKMAAPSSISTPQTVPIGMGGA